MIGWNYFVTTPGGVIRKVIELKYYEGDLDPPKVFNAPFQGDWRTTEMFQTDWGQIHLKLFKYKYFSSGQDLTIKYRYVQM